MDRDDDILLDHEYDGIREMNHPAPAWWQMAFYLSILFGILYFCWYELGSGRSIQDEFDQGMRQLEFKSAVSRAATPPPSGEELERLSKDPETRNLGGVVFQSKCASCHNPHGEGGIGPNLTDDFWINGDGSASSIYEIVTQGRAERGMPPWASLLTHDELARTVAYVRGLRGTHPNGGKAPQGQEHHD